MRGLEAGLGGVAMRALLATVCLPTALWAADPAVSAARVDSILADWIDATSPGAAVLVTRDGDVLHQAGYGLANLEFEIPITPTTVFNIGSMAKQFTAFAVALLAERGRLSLADDIRTHIPEIPDFGEPITIRNLIDHTSGLREHYDLLRLAGWRYDDLLTADDVLRLVARQRDVNFPPGERFLYCNTGYTLLAEIVARVTGRPFPAWMHENVFTPLGMTNTTFLGHPAQLVSNRADSYTESGDGYARELLNSSDTGCSNLWTTVEDLVHWIRNLENGTLGGEAVSRWMSEAGVLTNGEHTDYAFGQFLGRHRGLRTVTHSGGIAGYRCVLIRFPEQRLAVAILGNAAWLQPTNIAKGIASLYLGDEMEPEESSERTADGQAEPAAVRHDPAALESFVGHYQLESGKLLRVERRADSLLLHNLSPDPFELIASSSSRFRLEDSSLQVSFQRDEENAVTGLKLHMGSSEIPAQRTALVELDPASLNALVGDYDSEELGTRYSLVNRDGKLVATHWRHPDTELIPLESGAFQGVNKWIRRVEFVRDEAGTASGFYVSLLGAKDVWFSRTRD